MNSGGCRGEADASAVLAAERCSVVVDVHSSGDVDVVVVDTPARLLEDGSPLVVVRVQNHACSPRADEYDVFTGKLRASRLEYLTQVLLPRLCVAVRCTLSGDREEGKRPCSVLDAARRACRDVVSPPSSVSHRLGVCRFALWGVLLKRDVRTAEALVAMAEAEGLFRPRCCVVPTR